MPDIAPEDVDSAAPVAAPTTIAPGDVEYTPEGRPRINVYRKPEKEPDRYQQMDLDAENTGLAASQQTSSDLSAHEKNSVGPAMINDQGEIGWKDEKGEFTPTDKNKHVVLNTPEGYHVYNRSDKTDIGGGPIDVKNFGIRDAAGMVTSRLVGLGHILGQGFATSAPGQLASVAKGGEVAAAAERQGIPIAKGAASPNPGTVSRATILSKIPWIGQPLREAGAETEHAIGARVGEVAAEASQGGEALSPAEAGATAREGITNWQKVTSQSEVGDEFKDVDRLMTKPAGSIMPKTRTVVNQLVGKYYGSGLAKVDPETGAVIPRSQAAKDMLDPLKQIFVDAKEGGKGLNYEQAKFLRTWVGDRLKNPGKYTESLNQQELQDIHGALTQDLGDVVKQGGGQPAVDAWQKATEAAQAASDRRRALDTILGSDAKTDEGLLKTITNLAGKTSSAGVRQLALVKQTLKPEDWKDISAAMINRMGKTVVGKGGDLFPDETFSPVKWAKQYGDFSEEGKGALFGARGTQYRDDLEDIAKVASKTPSVEKMAHAGGHGVSFMGGGMGTVAAFEMYEHVKELAHGNPLAMVGHALWFVPAAIGARAWSGMLANPASTRTIARWMKSVESVKTAPGANSAAEFNNASQALLGKIKESREMNEPGVMSSLGEVFSDLTKSLSSGKMNDGK